MNVLEFLFPEDLFGLLASANEIRHHFFCRAIWEVFVNFEVFLSQLSSYLVREGLKLSKAYSMVVKASLSNLGFGLINSILIVRRYEKHAVFLQVFDSVCHSLVVASVCLFD